MNSSIRLINKQWNRILNYLFSNVRVLLCILILLYLSSPYGSSKGFSYPLFMKDAMKQSDSFFDMDHVIELNYHLVINEPFIQLLYRPMFAFGTIDFGFGLELPMSVNQDLKFNLSTYQNTHDLLSKIGFIQYGYKNKNIFFARISPISNLTLGSGFIVSRYNNKIFQPYFRNLGMQIQVKYRGFKLESILSELFTQSILGAYMSINLGELMQSKNAILNQTKFGISFAADLRPHLFNTLDNTNRYYPIIKQESLSNSMDSIMIVGIEAKSIFIQHKFIHFGLLLDFGKIIQNGQGFAVAAVGTIWPNLLKLDYKLQMQFFFNSSFVPSYFHSLYDIKRSQQRQNLANKQSNYGLLIEVSQSFFNKQLRWTMAYQHVFNNDEVQHLFFELLIHEPSFFPYFDLHIRYDRFALINGIDIFHLNNLESFVSLHFVYKFNRLLRIGFSVNKGFKVELKSEEPMSSSTTYSIFTMLTF